MFGIARNKRVDYFESRKNHPEHHHVVAIDSDVAMSGEDQKKLIDPLESVVGISEVEQWVEAIDKLPDETQRRVLHLRFVEGWTPGDIQNHFGWKSQSAVNYHINQGLQNLRKILGIQE